ncbi:hypothetical protein OUZ56_015786 [Daphnia magna]|uniref:Uncharacterized protein n=1 Tax=Daphnia magna TaxID=35525 RepID=A0ABR0ANR4_9CRUS|nr:hypothetical protein OUZ56_015786 [Daphnia magna]
MFNLKTGEGWNCWILGNQNGNIDPELTLTTASRRHVSVDGNSEVLNTVIVAEEKTDVRPSRSTAAAGTCWTAEKAKTTSTAARLTSEKRWNMFER